MQSLYLKQIQLENYRNFNQFDLTINNNPVALVGKNGSGKTNILEAISQLFPGKGIRAAKFDEVCRYGEQYWHINTALNSKLGTADLSIQYKHLSKRLNIFNGSKIPSNELSRLLSIIWLTPQMDNIFCDSVSDRRRFFDRIVYNFDLEHAANLNKYDYYITERLRMLTSGSFDANWIKVLDRKLAEIAVLIAIARVNTLIKLQKTIDSLRTDFPQAVLGINGDVEMAVLNNKDNIVDYVEYELFKNRSKDQLTCKTNFGTHRSDFFVVHKKHNKPAKFGSTGEQKAMLVSIALAQLHTIIQEQMIKPIVLLDEVFVHLDDKRKACLSEFIIFSNIQAWVTSTDIRGIEKFTTSAELIKL